MHPNSPDYSPTHARDVLTNVLVSLVVTFLGALGIAYYLLCDMPEIMQ